MGGYPLYLYGGAPDYSDIDLYTNDWETYRKVLRRLDRAGHYSRWTRHTATYQLPDDVVQVVRPGVRSYTDDELLASADLSPSACLLTADGLIRVLYPDDIASRICRVLVSHEWMPVRCEQYKRKGYTIVYEGDN